MAAENERREEFRVRGDQVAEKIKSIIREGRARKIILRKPNGEIIREFSLNRGLAAGALLAWIAPMLVAVGAIVALLSEVRIEVIRPDSEDEAADPESE